MDEILKTIELEFTILEFHEKYVISQVREGVIFTKKQVQDLVEVCADFYKRKKFLYISRRIHNYNVDPTIYLDIKNVKNLAGIAIVSENALAINMANFEKNFSKVPFNIFLKMDEAVEWVEEVLKNKTGL